MSGSHKPYEIWTVFGTRPETIKMAPVVAALKAHPQVRCVVCVTAQHRQMLDQVLDAYALEPDLDLDIMQAGQSLTDITTRVLGGLQSQWQTNRPDCVLVHGDTTTAFAAALAAFYAQIPVGHVEAGLRTYNKFSPYPEEANRCLISQLATYHFAPTQTARAHLLDEKIPDSSIALTGNTAIDALYMSLARPVKGQALASLLDWVGDSKLILLTAHRRENLGQPMKAMFEGIARVLDRHPEAKLIYPVHLNPQVQQVAQAIFGQADRVRLIEPLDVVGFHHLMNRAHLILTDSGGIQEEAPALGKPVLVLRDTTERPEGVRAGTLKLVGTQSAQIEAALEHLLTDEQAYRQMSQAQNPYGDGRAAGRLVEGLMSALAGHGLAEGVAAYEAGLQETRR